MSGSPGVIKRGGNCSGTRAEPEKAEKAGRRCHGGVEAVFGAGGHGEAGRHRRRFNGCCLSLQRLAW